MRESTIKKEIWEWTKALLIALVVVVIIRWLLFASYEVEGHSMEPNFHDRERIIVNKILYDFRAPKRGEVVILHAPDGTDYIKRVVALAGESVQVKGDSVLINGEPITEPYIRDQILKASQEGRFYNNRDFPTQGSSVLVPDHKVFVMGDNRSNSKDSRMIGFVDLNDIVGRADVIYWPPRNIDLVQQ